MKIKKPWVSWEEFEKIQAGDWTPHPHTHVMGDIIDTPWIWADVSKAGSNLTDLATRQHAGLTNITANQHHAQSHTLASHSTKAHSELTGVTSDLHHAQDHASRHYNAGADAIKLDDLAEPDNTVDLNSSISRHGLFPKLSNHPAQCLSGIGQWLTLYDSTSIVICILSKASGTTRNSNNTERTTIAVTYFKKKETKLGEPTGKMRIYFEIKATFGSTAYGKIYKNGNPIGTERSTTLTTYQSYTQDLGPFNAQDLIQIYIKTSDETAYVRRLRFQYDRSINMLGECILTTPLSLTTHNPFSMQNQDP